MWKGYYGKEPFDLRLTILRMLYKLPLIVIVTLLGTVIFGGGYYVKNTILRGERLYRATSVYHVEYAVEDPKDVATIYVNETSWNTYMQSQMFLDAVQGCLAQAGAGHMSDQEVAGTMQASVESDLRMLSTSITSDSPEKSVEIAQAVEAALTGELANELSEINYITVVDPGDTGEEVLPDMRVGRAFGLSALLSGFFVIVILLLKEIGDDAIWLPDSIWKRYGVRTVGTVESRELAENVTYFFAKAARIAVCEVQEGIDSEKVLQKLREACPEVVSDEWFAVESPLQDPKVARQLREAEGVLLAVKAGCHGGRKLERVLEYLKQQDCPVTAAILWEADERLLRRYYFCSIPTERIG